MTTTIRDINELQDRRIMMEKKLPPFGYALILLTAALILFLVVWSTKNYRTYVSQSSGSVQAANKTYIMSSYSGSITELNIAEGSYVNEGDLIAHIKSTDLDMQQDSIQSQLDIYKKQKSQYEKLVKSIQDDKNYFSETDIDDQPYYYQYETYKSQVAQKAFDASPYQAAGYSDEQIDLAEEYGVSRVTMRQSLAELEKDGIIIRERGRGSFVNETPRPILQQLKLPSDKIDRPALTAGHPLHAGRRTGAAPQRRRCPRDGKDAPPAGLHSGRSLRHPAGRHLGELLLLPSARGADGVP